MGAKAVETFIFKLRIMYASYRCLNTAFGWCHGPWPWFIMYVPSPVGPVCHRVIAAVGLSQGGRPGADRSGAIQKVGAGSGARSSVDPVDRIVGSAFCRLGPNTSLRADRPCACGDVTGFGRFIRIV